MIEGETQECVICNQDIDKQILTRYNPITDTEVRDVYWTEGHNAEPVKKGRCSTHCNNTVVVPTRLALLLPENALDSERTNDA